MHVLKYLEGAAETHAAPVEEIIRSLQRKNLSLVTKPDLEHLMAAEEKEARERGVPWFKFAEDEAMLKAIEKAKAAMV